MKLLILLSTISVFIMSCGQNDTKQKELELKERELALKEKEFALKEKDSVLTQTTTSTKTVQQISTNSIRENFIGVWKHINKPNATGYISIDFIKITKDANGKLIFQRGDNTNSEKEISWVTQDDVYPKFSNGTLVGKYRVYEGSAPDAYYETKFIIQLKTDNIILFKSNVHSGGGENSNESFEATKIK